MPDVTEFSCARPHPVYGEQAPCARKRWHAGNHQTNHDRRLIEWSDDPAALGMFEQARQRAASPPPPVLLGETTDEREEPPSESRRRMPTTTEWQIIAAVWGFIFLALPASCLLWAEVLGLR